MSWLDNVHRADIEFLKGELAKSRDEVTSLRAALAAQGEQLKAAEDYIASMTAAHAAAQDQRGGGA